MSNRIQKVLAKQGIASRREIERWIAAGEIEVDGEICKLGKTIHGNESITIRGKPIKLNENVQTRVLLYHKPTGEVVTRDDPKDRPTVFENLPSLKTGRWITVGRLDINTSGLLLLTTDGELANRLMHPSSEIEREYKVRVLGKITDEMLTRLQRGVQLEDGLASFDLLEIQETKGINTWCTVVIKEGRNREVRRLWESQGLKVNRLIRIRFGSLRLPQGLKRGSYLELNKKDLTRLYNLSG